MTRQVALGAAAVAFMLVAILNCGGYRYGDGDQAFYVPAVVQHLNPALFPRDRVLLNAQDRFLLFDDAFAMVNRGLGLRVPVLFFVAHMAGLLLLFSGLIAVGRSLYRTWWGVTLLVTLMTLRHRITQTGANSLEAYFQPRMVAFALGVWAIAFQLRSKGTRALLMIAAAFALHPTTALWFAIWIAASLAVGDRRWRWPVVCLGATGTATAVWMVVRGPLRGHLQRMDPLWASAMAGKDYIFPADWSTSFWLVNFGYLVVAAAIFLTRRRRGLTTAMETGMLAGAFALALVFLVSWPLMSAGIALALQLQTSRVFWMIDFLATIYLAWWMAEGISGVRVRQALVVLLAAAAVTRGVYVLAVEHAGDPVVRIDFPRDSWTDAMAWIARTPADSHVLADPGHAWKYGTSVRVSGERDVYVEEVKDLALALYSREVALRALERIGDARGFNEMSAADLRTLARKYDLDYVVLDKDIDLPEVYRNDRFRIYSLTDRD